MALRSIDLMIGDWVFVHKPTCKGHRVDYINEMDEEIGADGEIYDVCDIRPIPLTPEILEKNGFSNNYTEDDLSYATDAGGDIIGVHIVAGRGVMDEMYFNYVHELQHALRLCGIEKEIEL